MNRKKFEQLARDEAKKSTCAERKVGCIIVTENGDIIGRGHNASKLCQCNATTLSHQLKYSGSCADDVTHAEVMALHEAYTEFRSDAKELPVVYLYVTHPPCNECLAAIQASPAKINIIIAEQFIKFDDDKLRFDLIPPEWEEALAKVLSHGAKKYKSNNWQTGEIDRYIAATMRHFNAYRSGEFLDSDSGMPHLWHVMTNIGFLITLEADK